MGWFARNSPSALLLIGYLALCGLPSRCFALQTLPQAGEIDGIPSDARAFYQKLNDLRPDGNQVYDVHELNIRRDVLNLRFIQGKMAFLQPFDGRVTGAVFTGKGYVFATPHDRGERLSLARYLGVPMLDQSFSQVYLRFTDDTASEIKRQLDSAGAVAKPDPEFAESWKGLVVNLNPWHSLRIMLDWLSTNPQPYFYAGIESDSAGAFDVLVDDRREEQVLIGQPRPAGDVRFYDVWASFPRADAPARMVGSFAPVDYRVDTTIEENLSLTGVTTLHLRTIREGERIFPIELSRNLAVEKITLDDGRPLAFFQNEDLNRREILSRGNDSLLLVLPAPAKVGQEFRLTVEYHGSVISDAGNGVEFVGDRGTWYAHLGGADHFVPFDLSFRWPKRFTLVATGTKVESHEEGDPKSGRWRSGAPFNVAGFNLGEYKMESVGTTAPKIQLYANRELEDAIQDRIRQNSGSPTLPVLPPFQSSTAEQGLSGLTAQLVSPSPAAVLKQLGTGILDSIHFFEKLNGPFPFDHLDVSQIPGSFGQGWPELIYLSTLAFLPPEVQTRAGVAERTQEEARELMPYHEVVHQWWGNQVTSASYRDAWIEEAVANYLALLFADSQKPGDHRMINWLDEFRTALATKLPGAARTIESAGPLSFGSRLTSSKTPGAYETVVYGKGTWIIRMLYEMLRDPASKDPDARFRELLRTILIERKFQPLSTLQFQRAVERLMTPSMDLEGTHSMDWFFEEWVRTTGIPHYKVEFQVKARGQQFLVTGELKQSGVDDNFTAPVPLYAARTVGKPEILGTVVSTGGETRFHFISRVRPSRILIDPHSTLLCLTE